MKQTPLCVYAIGNAENNSISFVALYGFEVLDKERFVAVILEEELFFRCILPPFGKQFVDQILLGKTECNNTKTPVRVFFNVLINQINDKLCFLPIGVSFAIKNAVHVVIIYTDPRRISLRGREGHKITVIEILVGERDKLFIAAAVMPA